MKNKLLLILSIIFIFSCSSQIDEINYKEQNKRFDYSSIDSFKKTLVEHFNDDLDWVRDNLIFLSDVVYIDYKDKHNSSSIEEIILMSKCKNHIISNSSFSWWGTWLCQKNDQVNISPKKWDNTI